MLETNSLDVIVDRKVLIGDLSFTIEMGQNWAILGANGTGKSSLLRLLSGVTKSEGDDVYVDEISISSFSKKSLAKEVGLLPQFEEQNYWGSVGDYVGLGRFAHAAGLWGQSKDDQVITKKSLENFDIENLSNREYRGLSGGERQRARLASLMAQDPKIFLWDEPLENLDYSGQMKFLSWINQTVRTKNKASVMVVHDINLVSRFFTHTLMVFPGGSYMAGVCNEIMTRKNLSELYQTRFDQVIYDGARLFVPGW
ncbi:ABC transporter ATP-binding protein [Burkholderiales bacterium]|nr:ABC transporter ATP-binding protein [Burkholderiales bacterium]